MIPAVLQSQNRSQGTNCRARIAHKQIGILVGKLAARANHIIVVFGNLSDGNTECIQSGQHHTRVVRVKHVTHAGDLPFLAQSRQQQHAVGNAF